MSRETVPTIFAALLAGAVAGALVAGVMSNQRTTGVGAAPVPQQELRDAFGQLVAVNERTLERLEELEAAVELVAARSGDAAALARTDRDLALEIRALREDLQRELERTEQRLTVLETAVEGIRPGSADADVTELSEEQLRLLAIQASDDDPGIRFSALSKFGASRTDRAVQASTERLDDEADLVVWQALRNLGRFKETAVALRVAEHLDHEASIVRAAAWKALREMGAPDAGFDPTAAQNERRDAVDALRAWADANQ